MSRYDHKIETSLDENMNEKLINVQACMKEKYEKKDKNSKENSKLIKAFPKLKRRDPKMSLKKI